VGAVLHLEDQMGLAEGRIEPEMKARIVIWVCEPDG